jgi:hypothetical protein
LALGDWDTALAVGGGGFLLVELGKWVAARRHAAAVKSGGKQGTS